MDITINPNPAQSVTADVTETFDDFADKVQRTSHKSIQHGNGEPVELNAGASYSVLALELDSIATPDQFAALFGIILQAVDQATTAGVIPQGWFKGITTLFDLYPPQVPEPHQDEEHQMKMFLCGETYFTAARVPK